MNCPHCQISYDPDHWQTCPHCGSAQDRPGRAGSEFMEMSGVLRTSTIVIAEGDRAQKSYGSLEEVPEPLRSRLVESTNGLNSGVIYIADQRGREQITRALRDLPKAVAPAPVSEHISASLAPEPPRRLRTGASLSVFWFPLLLLASAGAAIWLLGSRNW